jgi:hypothetical protein
VCIDGSTKYDLNFGDSVELYSNPDYRLKCMKFILDTPSIKWLKIYIIVIFN